VTNLALPLDTSQLTPGLRLAIGLSGGADSVALTRALAARSAELGIVLHIAHLHHGLRGPDADADQQFCADLAASLHLPFHTHRIDTESESSAQLGKSRESIEEAARRLRYAWFRQLLTEQHLDAIATAHTLDDQAETVLAKFLRGAWTEGLSGIYPIVVFSEGRILRPVLATSRREIETYLATLNQPWREDASNRDLAFTRNRIRHELLPALENWNPSIRNHLANMASLARDEESWWQSELSRLAPLEILSGRPVRGGGRASSESLAFDILRLAAQPVALQRRLLRQAAQTLGISLSFDATESLRQLALTGRSGQKLSLPGIAAERTARELALRLNTPAPGQSSLPQESLPVPGETSAFGHHFTATGSGPAAIIRVWRPGDRVTLRHSSGPRKVKEVLDRLKITGDARTGWPVIEWQGKIVWMQGADLESTPGLSISVHSISG
jgi:tRNA(Ile)-lysidine synthase